MSTSAVFQKGQTVWYAGKAGDMPAIVAAVDMSMDPAGYEVQLLPLADNNFRSTEASRLRARATSSDGGTPLMPGSHAGAGPCSAGCACSGGASEVDVSMDGAEEQSRPSLTAALNGWPMRSLPNATDLRRRRQSQVSPTVTEPTGNDGIYADVVQKAAGQPLTAAERLEALASAVSACSAQGQGGLELPGTIVQLMEVRLFAVFYLTQQRKTAMPHTYACLLYTSDAADE